MKKIKTLLKVLFSLIGIILVAAIIAIFVIVDKEFIETQMENALHRNVSIESIDVSVFSIVSGIEVNKVAISNFINEETLKKESSNPVNENNIFISLESFKFKVKFLPLLKKELELKEIVLYTPQINIIRTKNGFFNFSDLIESDKPEEPKKETAKDDVKKEDNKSSQPLTADTIPISINIGKIGIENGQVRYTDQQLNQIVQLSSLTFLVHSIEFDPENLENENSVKIKFNTNIKTVGKMKSGSIESFDINLSADAQVTPFDAKTRILNPEVFATAGSNRGTLTGLQIFTALKDIEQIEKYCGKLSFLKNSINWTGMKTSVWYKNGTIKTKDGKIKTSDYTLSFAGQSNINTKKIDYDVEMILADKYLKTVKTNLGKNIEKGIKSLKASKYITTDKVIDSAVKPMLNENGKLYFIYKITGTFAKPKPKLTAPKLPSIQEVIKDSLGDAADLIKDKIEAEMKEKADKAKRIAEEKAKAEAKKKADEAKSKTKDKAKDAVKKFF